MSRTRFNHVAVAVAVCTTAVGTAAPAGTVQFQLGEQDFADGLAPVLSADIRTAGAGEPGPFDGTIFGNDLQASLGSFEYAHSFDLRGAMPVSATLTLGLIDADSPASSPLDTIGLRFDGVEQPAGLFAGISAPNSPSSAEVVDIAVPLELLADGSVTVSVFAKRPRAGNLGNAIEADFSRLVVEFEGEMTPVPGLVDPPPPAPDGDGTDGGGGGGGGGDPEPVPVPIPTALWPVGLFLAGLFAIPKRVLRRWLRM